MNLNNSKHQHSGIDDANLTSSLEDYLKAIYTLKSKHAFIRVKDIAREMNNSMPSVCAALARLKTMGLVEYEKYDHIEFTHRGESIGYRVSRKFDCLREFLTAILMLQGPDISEMACCMEHGVSYETFLRLERMLMFFEKERLENASWIMRYEKFQREGDGVFFNPNVSNI